MIDVIEDAVAAGFRTRANVIAPKTDVPAFGAQILDIAALGFGIGTRIARISFARRAFIMVNSGNRPGTTACGNIVKANQIQKSFARTVGTADDFRHRFACAIQTLLTQLTGNARIILTFGIGITAKALCTAVIIIAFGYGFTSVDGSFVAVGITRFTC